MFCALAWQTTLALIVGCPGVSGRLKVGLGTYRPAEEAIISDRGEFEVLSPMWTRVRTYGPCFCCLSTGFAVGFKRFPSWRLVLEAQSWNMTVLGFQNNTRKENQQSLLHSLQYSGRIRKVELSTWDPTTLRTRSQDLKGYPDSGRIQKGRTPDSGLS